MERSICTVAELLSKIHLDVIREIAGAPRLEGYGHPRFLPVPHPDGCNWFFQYEKEYPHPAALARAIFDVQRSWNLSGIFRLGSSAKGAYDSF